MTRSRRRPTLPSAPRDLLDLVIPAIVLVLLALYAPLFGAVFSLLVLWHSHHHGLVARRNIAIVCSVLAIINLVVPGVLMPALTI